MSEKSRLNGFSLVELLTVIAIIGILAAILLPVVGTVRQNARTAQAASNLRQIGAALGLYVAESKGRLPYDGGAPGPVGWRNQTIQYLTGGATSGDAATRMREYVYINANQTPSWVYGGGDGTSYSGHQYINSGAQYHYSRISRPSRTIFIADGTATEDRGWSARNTLFSFLGNINTNNGLPPGKSLADPLDGDDGLPPGNASSKFAYRNRGLALAAHFDSSVRSYRQGEITYGNLVW
jgi:prepilin-type N-terminal cleavage/methylation domain-containing protein